MVLVDGADYLLLGQIADRDPVVISAEIEICLVMINVLDGVAVVAVTMHQLRLSLA